MARKIYLTSLKGGTGVTTCCIGLGYALAEAGERTLIVDGDRRSANGLTLAGCGNLQVFTLADYAKGACRAKQTLVSHPAARNLSIMPSIGLEDPAAAKPAVEDVNGLFDYILCDKIVPDVCEEGIIVTEPFLPAIKSADCCRSALADGGMKEISLIVNKLSGGQILNGDTMTAQEIATVLHLPLRAVIPEDLTLSAGKWRPSTLKAFRMAADSLTGRREAICNVMKSYFGPSGWIKRKMRERI